MKIFVANTDIRWYRFLSDRDQTSEVNFWRPRGGTASFRAISPGELLFFRLGKPVNKIAGFGLYWHHSVIPLHMAWDTFGEANGAATRQELVALIAKHRGEPVGAAGSLTWQIGCTILVDVHYYPEHAWLEFRFPPGLVQGRRLTSTALTALTFGIT